MANPTKKPLTPPTADLIRAWLENSDSAVEEALLKLYARQTTDEHHTRDAKHRNHRGFSARDAKCGSKYAVWIIGMRRDHGTKPGHCLTRADHKAKAREITLRYVRQLLEEATAKHEAATQTVTVPVIVDDSAAQLDAEMDAMVQDQEADESRRVADFKMMRDDNLGKTLHAPGTKVYTSARYGFPTADSAISVHRRGGGKGFQVTIPRAEGKAANADIQGLVIGAERLDDGTPVNHVLFGRTRVWIMSEMLKKV